MSEPPNAPDHDHSPSWPVADVDGPRHTIVRFEPAYDVGPKGTISIRRLVLCGGTCVADTTVLAFSPSNETDANNWRNLVSARPEDWAFWGRLTATVGSEAVVDLIRSAVDAAVERERCEIEASRTRDAHQAELRQTIDSFLRDGKGGYGVTLQRRSEPEPFWAITFRERWERERFRDWWRCQRHRYGEFADHAEAHDALALERLVLGEMLATEKAVKAAGVATGGRRPLRFWRG